MCKDIDSFGCPNSVRYCSTCVRTLTCLVWHVVLYFYVIGTVLVVSLGDCFTCVRESWGSDGGSDGMECALY